MNTTAMHPRIRDGQQKAIAIFHRAVAQVPAYADFLKKSGVEPASVVSYEDFQQVPPTSKENYIEKYSLEELAWTGKLDEASLIHSSSGTSGTPYYWPCSDKELMEAMKLYETVYRGSFKIGDKYQRTLLIICFGMGTWIAGSYTTSAALLLRLQGLPLTIVTPGFNRLEALRLMNNLGGSFDQVVVAGIPSFMKDLLDEWSQCRKVNFPKIRVLLAGEGFPEPWREHVAESIGGDVFDIISLLGSADAGLIGFESNQSITLRRAITNDAALRQVLVRSDRTPGILHFDPCHRFIETTQEGRLLLTADRAIPLIRYDTMDVGGILSNCDDQITAVKSAAGDPIAQWPLVYIFGRGSKSATLFGANIYAEWIQEFLVSGNLRAQTTGRFQIETTWLPNADQQLLVRIELGEGLNPSGQEPRDWAQSLAQLLRLRSSEYTRICEEYGDRALPAVSVYRYGSPEYFPTIQQKCS